MTRRSTLCSERVEARGRILSSWRFPKRDKNFATDDKLNIYDKIHMIRCCVAVSKLL